MAKWTTKEVNDFNDSSFLYIEKGGKKVDGKTEPRTLRHLPYKNKEGKVDLPHVRNALARINQVKTKDGKELSKSIVDKLTVILEKILEKAKERTGMSIEEVKEEVIETKLEFEDDDKIEDNPILSDKEVKIISKPDTITTTKPVKKIKVPKVVTIPFKETVTKPIDKSNENELKLKADNTQTALNEALSLNDEMIITLNESKDEINNVKQLNGDLMNKLQEMEAEITAFQATITQYEQEKKEVKINKMFDQYCSFFDISENEKSSVRKMMSTMSEDMLEQTTTLFSQKRKSTNMVAPLTKPSATLNQYSKSKPITPDFTKMTAKEKVDYEFAQYTKTNR